MTWTMAMSTQQAIVFPSLRAPFALGPRPVPVPDKGGIRLKIMAAGLNPFNYAQQKTGLFVHEYPAVIGTLPA